MNKYKIAQIGALLTQKYTPFKIPTGTTYLPVNSATGWSMQRNGGSPASALSVVDIDSVNTKMINSTKAIRFNTGVTGHSSNYVRCSFAPVDMSIKNILIWVRFVEGVGISSFEKALGLYVQLLTSTSDFYQYLLGAPSVEYSSAGWYSFSLTPSKNSSVTGSPNLNNVTAIGIGTSKALTDSPIMEIGMVAIVSKPVKAQICFMCDGGYASHKPMSELLTLHGMYGTFYVAEDTHILSIAELQAMQANGHLIAAYIRDWGNTLLTGIGNLITLITNCQTFLSSNNLNGGKYLIHGITSRMTEEAWKTIFPKYANSCGYGYKSFTSRYQKTYTGRYHEFTSANKASLITLVNQAVSDGSKFGILCHELVGADYTAFVDFVENTLVPLQIAGSIEVINVKQAFDSIV